MHIELDRQIVAPFLPNVTSLVLEEILSTNKKGPVGPNLVVLVAVFPADIRPQPAQLIFEEFISPIQNLHTV